MVSSGQRTDSVMRRLRDEKSELGYDEAIWQQMIELGWPGMAIAEKYGGFEFGYTGLGLVLEETGRTLASSPLSVGSFGCQSLV